MTRLSQFMNNVNMLPCTWYNTPNYPWKARNKKGVCKVGTPPPDRGIKNKEMWDVLNRCLPCWNCKARASKRLTDAVTGDETFTRCCMACPQNRKMWCGSMKPGTDESSPDLNFRARRASPLCFSTNAGLLPVDILPEKTTMTSRRYTGTVLPTVDAAAQDHRPNMVSMLLHGNAAPHKTRATI